jgi:hypothetical protein
MTIRGWSLAALWITALFVFCFYHNSTMTLSAAICSSLIFVVVAVLILFFESSLGD